jgi:hypothetical protein
MARSTKIKGQSKTEFTKNYTRVKDIITKAGGDNFTEKMLAERQANLITDEIKAINRAMAAKEIGNETIFEVFFRRAFKLGSVTGVAGKLLNTQDVQKEYREYVIKKLLENE